VGEMKTLSAFKEIEDEFEFEGEDDDGERLGEKKSRPAQLAAIRPGIS
jgi:hypothetical protein